MSFRWFVIFGILVWCVYEYTNHMWANTWSIHSKNMKYVLAVGIVVVLVCAPSIECLIQKLHLESYLQKVLVNNTHQHHYQYPNETIDIEMFHQMQNGAKIARKD